MKRRILMIGTGVLLLLLTAGVALPGKIKQTGEKAARIATTDRTKPIEQKTVPLPPATADSPRPVKQEQPSALTTSTSATYEIDWQSINGGGGDIQSTNYKMQSSIGQSATGYATSTSYQLGAGYWYGVGGNTGCSCPSQGDIDGDTDIDVFDVIGIIGIAFSGSPDIQDPPCPKTRADADNSGATDVFDVIYLIATAFSGGPNPVDPCA
jgi:hypothetical protein